MATKRMSFAASLTYVPRYPERTSYRNTGGSASLDFDVEYKEWSSEGAMRTAIAMQAQREPSSRDWRAWSDSRMAKGGR